VAVVYGNNTRVKKHLTASRSHPRWPGGSLACRSTCTVVDTTEFILVWPVVATPSEAVEDGMLDMFVYAYSLSGII
jgi:hypothetical protein